MVTVIGREATECQGVSLALEFPDPVRRMHGPYGGLTDERRPHGSVGFGVLVDDVSDAL